MWCKGNGWRKREKSIVSGASPVGMKIDVDDWSEGGRLWKWANQGVVELRIHEETEKGDNDTIKVAGRGLCGP